MPFVSAIFTPLYPEYRSPRATRKSDRYADVCRRLCEAHRDDIAPAGGISADASARMPRTRAPAKRAAKKSASSDDGGDGDGPARPHFTISKPDGVVIGAASGGTLLFLMAQYGAKAVIPIETVCADYFGQLTLPNLRRKIASGDIPLPIVRMERDSKKATQGIHIQDLAAYIDERRAAAVKERDQLCF